MAEDNKTDRRTSGVSDAQDKLESSKTHARKAAEDLKSAAGAVANRGAPHPLPQGEPS